MPDPISAAIASKIADSIVAGVSSRLKIVLLGTEERRALDRAVRRVFSGLSYQTCLRSPEVMGYVPLDYYFGQADLAAILVESAFAGIEPNRNEVVSQLIALGYDESTSPLDVVDLAVEFSTRLGSEIRWDADRNGSVLFNRLILAKLDRIDDRLQSAGSRTAMLCRIAVPRHWTRKG